MLRDPEILDIPPKLFDESAQQTEEALTDAEIADIASRAIDAAGKEPKGLMSPADKASTSPMLTEEGVEQEVAKVLGDTLGDLDPMGQGYEAYLERYTTVDNVDFDFIKELEGYKTDMYVPKIDGEVLEESGATIASGFDLGQRNESDLKGLPRSLINKLKPYLGKKKKAADDFVKANPLTITEKEADIINAFAKKQELDRLIEDWNNSSDVKWENLSEPQATTVASVAFQFGNLPTRTPKFWRYTTTGDWAAARDELRDFYGKDKKGLERQEIYGPRRDKEADYLEQDNAAILGTKAY
jgi:GH24 family phage-related lysozyme (muramidase)